MTTDLRSPLTKEAGTLKEQHEVELGLATPVFDIRSYVEEFGASIVPAYRRGVADDEWPADVGLARSVVPPGTAATRDFSRLAPRLPQLIAERCVGCMACVSACPDSAIIGIAIPEGELADRITTFAAGEPDPAAAEEGARAHFVRTQKYAEVPSKRGLEPASFGIFVEPIHCKGCAECLEVCAALGHDALFMTDKTEEGRSGETVLDDAVRDVRFFRSLPPTPQEYRNETALADVMLGEQPIGYVCGAGSCAGCGEASAIWMMVAATRQVHGPDSMGIVAATGCNSVFGSTYPFNPYLVPWTNSLFENAPAV